jgi:hypothetical protein
MTVGSAEHFEAMEFSDATAALGGDDFHFDAPQFTDLAVVDDNNDDEYVAMCFGGSSVTQTAVCRLCADGQFLVNKHHRKYVTQSRRHVVSTIPSTP